MTVVMTSEAFGKQPGENYTGEHEAWLKAEGYAKLAGYSDDTAAVLSGSTTAINVVTGGNIVIGVAHKTFTVAIATSDTPAQAATKIDTALAGYADAAIVSNKLTITSTATGSDAYVRVDSGTGTVLSNLKVTAGQRAEGGNGGIGVSNTGLTATTPANDPTLASNREPEPERDEQGRVDPGVLDPAMTFSTADDDPNDAQVVDFNPGGVNNDAPTVTSVTPATGAAAGGTAITIEGKDFTGATGGTAGGVALTSFVVVDDTTITAVTGVHAAGAVTVAVTNPTGTGSKATAFTYTA